MQNRCDDEHQGCLEGKFQPAQGRGPLVTLCVLCGPFLIIQTITSVEKILPTHCQLFSSRRDKRKNLDDALILSQMAIRELRRASFSFHQRSAKKIWIQESPPPTCKKSVSLSEKTQGKPTVTTLQKSCLMFCQRTH